MYSGELLEENVIKQSFNGHFSATLNPYFSVECCLLWALTCSFTNTDKKYSQWIQMQKPKTYLSFWHKLNNEKAKWEKNETAQKWNHPSLLIVVRMKTNITVGFSSGTFEINCQNRVIMWMCISLTHTLQVACKLTQYRRR